MSRGLRLLLPALALVASAWAAPVPQATYDDAFGSEGTADGQFRQPFGVTVSEGRVYVSDFANNRVQRFTTSGEFRAIVGASASLRGPTGVAVNPANGDLYVADAGNHRIVQFNKDGGFIRAWGSLGFGDGQFNVPAGVAFSAKNEQVYVSEQNGNRVQRFSTSGTFRGKWGSAGSGDGQFNAPDGIAVDPATGQIFVAEFGNNRIQRFTATGGFVRKWGTLGSANGQLRQPIGLTVDGESRVYVADTGNDRIQIFDAQGKFLAKFGQSGSGSGKLDQPEGVALSSDNVAFVAEYGNNRVSRWTITNRNRPPTVVITGPARRSTSAPRAWLRGTASDPDGSGDLKLLTFTEGTRTFSVPAKSAWSQQVWLRRGTNVFEVVATDQSGAQSAKATVTIVRRTN